MLGLEPITVLIPGSMMFAYDIVIMLRLRDIYNIVLGCMKESTD